MNDETIAIETILNAQQAAWCEGDASEFSRAVAPDVVFTNVVGLFMVGREGFEAQHRHIFSTFYKGSILRQSVERIAFVRPDVAIVNTLTHVTGFGALPPAISSADSVLRTRLEQVMSRTDDGWRVLAFHNVVVHPLAETTAPAAS
jgi:uncharacterized protein (TIGR02246 family)